MMTSDSIRSMMSRDDCRAHRPARPLKFVSDGVHDGSKMLRKTSTASPAMTLLESRDCLQNSCGARSSPNIRPKTASLPVMQTRWVSHDASRVRSMRSVRAIYAAISCTYVMSQILTQSKVVARRTIE